MEFDDVITYDFWTGVLYGVLGTVMVLFGGVYMKLVQRLSNLLFREPNETSSDV